MHGFAAEVLRPFAEQGWGLELIVFTLVSASAVLAFSTALKVLYSRHSGRPDVIRPVSLFVVLGGVFCGFQTRSSLELFIVFTPLLIVVGCGFRLVCEGISEGWVLESKWYTRDGRIIRFRIPGGRVPDDEWQG